METTKYRGLTFNRYPPKERYFKCARAYYLYGTSILHRLVYQDAYGPIPKGVDIHHKDKNPANCSIENLEAIERKTHRKLHTGSYSNEYRQWLGNNARKVQHTTKKWHKSKEGKLWHSTHMEQIQANLPLLELVCTYCKQTYYSKKKPRGKKWEI